VSDLRICFLGESFVNGTGDPEGLGWVGRVYQTLCLQGHTVTAYNLGIRGETSTQLRSRWLDEVQRRWLPLANNRLVFSFGVNDTSLKAGQLRVDLETSVQNAMAILSEARSLCPVFVVGPLPIADAVQNQRIAQLSDCFATICQTLEIFYLAIYPLLKHSQVWQREVAHSDGAHPQAQGYGELAQLITDSDRWLSWIKA
jgi:lysophospholipase L1-like esterase